MDFNAVLRRVISSKKLLTVGALSLILVGFLSAWNAKSLYPIKGCTRLAERPVRGDEGLCRNPLRPPNNAKEMWPLVLVSIEEQKEEDEGGLPDKLPWFSLLTGPDKRSVWIGADLRLAGSALLLLVTVASFAVRTIRNSWTKKRFLVKSVFLLERKLEEAQVHAAEREARLAEAEQVRLRTLNESGERHAADMRRLEEELEEAGATIWGLKEGIQSAQRESNAKDERISTLEAQITTNEREQRAASAAAKSLQAKVDEVEETAKRDCREHVERIRTLEGQLFDALASVRDLSSVRREASALRLEVNRLTSGAESRARELETVRLQSAQESQENAQRLEALEGALEDAESKLTAQMTREESLAAEIKRLGQKADSEARQASGLKEELNRAQQDAQTKDQTIIGLKGQRVIDKEIRRDLVKKEKAAREEEQASLKKIKELESRVSQLQSNLREKDARLKSSVELQIRELRWEAASHPNAGIRRQSKTALVDSETVWVEPNKKVYHNQVNCLLRDLKSPGIVIVHLWDADKEGRQPCSACRQ
ncbi:hypothetical protein KFL_002080090 [Klebsormidium nitens]|uniref:Uncharacterized protein n=1 Tax=Klebsormidium nitens TaxID=105231 RepID=A0A1Y1I4E8_KLENI|nr:hypothetical protein KFL_002080090 [Klebsormidium nitens]|eukprot:GAQ84832.1 hypothetical protein KFL_002080090 [Klebsormidium nitens]